MTSNYLPPAILPTPPNYQDQQLHNKAVVDYSSSTVTNSLLGRPHLEPADSSASAIALAPPPTSAAVPAAAPSNVGVGPGSNVGVSPAKMFVGGLPQSVTQDTLNEYFGRYGHIVEAFVLMDDQSGRSRGFGFVTFENAQSLNDVLAARPHYLSGKHVDCKYAVLKSSPASRAADAQNEKSSAAGANFVPTMHPLSQHQQSLPQQQQRNSFDDISGRTAGPEGGGDNDEDDLFLTGGGKSYLALSGDKWLEDCAEADERKIFVGGLPDVTPAEFAGFFEHFGPVADAMVMFDRKRRRQRGFGFITFATNDGVSNALKYHRHPVKGKLVEVKKAHPLVLQKARAPARRERDQQLQAQQGQSRRGSPSLASAKRKTSTLESSVGAQAPWVTTSAEGTARHQDPWKRLRPEDEDEVFKQQVSGGTVEGPSSSVTTGFNPRQTKFPLAPWNQQLTMEGQQMKLEERPPLTMVPSMQQRNASPYFSSTVAEQKPPGVPYGTPTAGPEQHYPSATANPSFYAQPFSTIQQQPSMFAAPQYKLPQASDPYLSNNGYGVYGQPHGATASYDPFYLNHSASGPDAATANAYTDYQPPFVKR